MEAPRTWIFSLLSSHCGVHVVLSNVMSEASDTRLLQTWLWQFSFSFQQSFLTSFAESRGSQHLDFGGITTFLTFQPDNNIINHPGFICSHVTNYISGFRTLVSKLTSFSCEGSEVCVDILPNIIILREIEEFPDLRCLFGPHILGFSISVRLGRSFSPFFTITKCKTERSRLPMQLRTDFFLLSPFPLP